MFNFTTLTVYNEIKKHDLSQDGRRVVRGSNLIVGDSQDKPFIRIGNTRFDAADIEDIQEKVPTKENLASVTFDMADIIPTTAGEKTTGRIMLYVGLSMNCQDAFYANDFVYKGKPLFIEFPVAAGEEAEVVAKRVKKIADKYLLFVLGSERILDVTEDGGSVTFSGVNGYQIIKKAVMQKWNPTAISVDCCTDQGDYEDVITGVPAIYTTEADGTAVVGTTYLNSEGVEEEIAKPLVAINPGLEAFGDYNWLLHNLRLPTAANYYPWSPTNRAGEMPVPGQTYHQFIIRLKKERDGIMGEIVGARGTSVTTHVLYVAAPYAQIVKTELAKLHTIANDADTALQTPYAGI